MYQPSSEREPCSDDAARRRGPGGCSDAAAPAPGTGGASAFPSGVQVYNAMPRFNGKVLHPASARHRRRWRHRRGARRRGCPAGEMSPPHHRSVLRAAGHQVAPLSTVASHMPRLNGILPPHYRRRYRRGRSRWAVSPPFRHAALHAAARRARSPASCEMQLKFPQTVPSLLSRTSAKKTIVLAE